MRAVALLSGRFRSEWVTTVLLVGSLAAGLAQSAQCEAAAPFMSTATPSGAGSRVTELVAAAGSPEDFGTFHGVRYQRTFGIAHGTIDPREDVAVQPGPPLPGEYAVEFEIIAPADGERPSHTVLVEVENRGGPVFFWSLDGYSGVTPIGTPPSRIVYPPDGGNGFLFDHGVSYARIQWQTDFAPAVPPNAQGVGEIVLRDFGRMLRGIDRPLGPPLAPRFTRAILLGASQSAWFVNAFVAEGFNVNPTAETRPPPTLLFRRRPPAGSIAPFRIVGAGSAGASDAGDRRVYDAAITIDGAGNWLAINQLNAANGDPPETPYLQPDGVPLLYDEILIRPDTDPFLVDVVAYTDYYRVRASVTAGSPIPAGVRRYDIPSAHAPGKLASLAIVTGILGCNQWLVQDGPPQPLMPIVALNPLDPYPFARAILLGTLRAIDAPALPVDAPILPASVRFTLGGPIPAQPYFNPLTGVGLEVPAIDASTQPVGGVRFPEVDLPLGRLSPVAIPHVGTLSINDTCGNFGGYEPFSASEIAARYPGGRSEYLARYADKVDALIAQGFVLPADKPVLLDDAASEWSSATE